MLAPLRRLLVATLATAALPACAVALPPQGTAIAHPAPRAAATAERLRGRGLSGDVRRHAGVRSAFLARSRDVWVYLPPGYAAEPTRRYPVLYMHDGNNLFDPATAFLGNEWHVDETLEGLIRAGRLPPLIVVGVGNTPDRIAEYTWVPGEVDGQTMGGDGASYGRFLTEELKPMIDRAYRTRPGRADTAVMGSSLGGLQSFYLGRHHGAVFGKLGVVSPSVWWAKRAVLDEVAGMRRDMRIWLDFGHREGKDPQAGLADARELARRLQRRGWVDGRDMRWVEDPEGAHDEKAWARRFPHAVRFLFGAESDGPERSTPAR